MPRDNSYSIFTEEIQWWSVPLDPWGTCPACRRGHAHICQNLKFLGLDTDGAFQQAWAVPSHTMTQAGVDTMTETAVTGGRIVVVAIHGQKPRVDLFKSFWREIELFGARVYEPKDYDRAIALVAGGAIDCGAMITDVCTLDQITNAFEVLSGNAQAMKCLIQCT